MLQAFTAVGVAFTLAGILGACGDDEPSTAPAASTTAAATEPEAKPVSITGRDYAFDAADTIEGGLVEIEFTNAGKEAHVVGLAKIAEGKTIDDVKVVFSAPRSGAPPAGPPPFEEYAGVSTVDPGGVGNATFNLPAGSYALSCALPAPDGVPHVGKGMIRPLEVTEGIASEVPQSVASLAANDFSLAGAPPAEAGPSVVKIRNQGKQIHEVNLVELMPGKKLDDLVAWFKAPVGPPPGSFLSGVAVKPGEEGTTEFELEAGTSYTLICGIPDSLSGDFVPNIVKGMYMAAFTVS